MGDELPILKGILNGVVNYHNARRCRTSTITVLMFMRRDRDRYV